MGWKNSLDPKKLRRAKDLGNGTVVCTEKCQESAFDLFDFFFYDDDSSNCVITCNITSNTKTATTLSPDPSEMLSLLGVIVELPAETKMQLPPGGYLTLQNTAVVTVPTVPMPITEKTTKLINPLTVTLQTKAMLTLPERTMLILPPNKMVMLPAGTAVNILQEDMVELPKDTEIYTPNELLSIASGKVSVPPETKVTLPSGSSLTIQKGATLTLPPETKVNLELGTGLKLQPNTVVNQSSK